MKLKYEIICVWKNIHIFCFMLNLVIAFKNMHYIKWFHTIPRFEMGENAIGLLVLFFFYWEFRNLIMFISTLD